MTGIRSATQVEWIGGFMSVSDQQSVGGRSSSRVLSIVGAVLGVLALLFVPIVLGPVGAILGFIGYSRGDKPFGLYVGIGCIVTTIVGLVLGAVVYTSMN